MEIINSKLSDLPQIFEFYRLATEYMKSKNEVHWPEFKKELITTEISENRQWKLLIDDRVACIWATTLSDELIWGSENATPSLYIHRIATYPEFRGQNMTSHLIEWANVYAKEKNLEYLRLDTVGLNQGLIRHYKSLGFTFLGTRRIETSTGLPGHYAQGPVCFFQRAVV